MQILLWECAFECKWMCLFNHSHLLFLPNVFPRSSSLTLYYTFGYCCHFSFCLIWQKQGRFSKSVCILVWVSVYLGARFICAILQKNLPTCEDGRLPLKTHYSHWILNLISAGPNNLTSSLISFTLFALPCVSRQWQLEKIIRWAAGQTLFIIYVYREDYSNDMEMIGTPVNPSRCQHVNANHDPMQSRH